MPQIVTTKTECEFCDDEIEPKEVVKITVVRSGEETVSYVHNDCLEEQMTGNDFIESIVLHD